MSAPNWSRIKQLAEELDRELDTINACAQEAAWCSERLGFRADDENLGSSKTYWINTSLKLDAAAGHLDAARKLSDEIRDELSDKS